MKTQNPSIQAWLRLFLGLATIYLFIAVVLPALSRLPMSRAAIEVIEQQEIDPRALFYTESGHAVEAGRAMQEKVSAAANASAE